MMKSIVSALALSTMLFAMQSGYAQELATKKTE